MKFNPTNLPIESDRPKLVRDNIPEIIKVKTGKYPKVETIVCYELPKLS